MSTELHYRNLAANELARVAEIDRTERIDAIYVQHGTRLELVVGDRSSPPWDAEGDGEHSVATLRHMLEEWMRRGATMRGRSRTSGWSVWVASCLIFGPVSRSFYLARGYAPMEEPLPELFELEPEDIHMEKAL